VNYDFVARPRHLTNGYGLRHDVKRRLACVFPLEHGRCGAVFEGPPNAKHCPVHRKDGRRLRARSLVKEGE
jgi:hypothetical protein